MNTKGNNSEANTTNNQLAFEKFCKLSQEGYYIQVDLNSRLRDKASFWITATKENEEREKIQLFLNEKVLELVLNYLESGKLGDISKINPCDLESFNERNIDFKNELLQTEKKKGKTVIWDYSILGRLISIHYKQGVIIFHPYPSRNNPINKSRAKAKQETTSISKDPYIQIELNNLIFGSASAYALEVFSHYYPLVSIKKEENLLRNNSFIDNKETEKGKPKTSLLRHKLKMKLKHQVLSDL